MVNIINSLVEIVVFDVIYSKASFYLRRDYLSLANMVVVILSFYAPILLKVDCLFTRVGYVTLHFILKH